MEQRLTELERRLMRLEQQVSEIAVEGSPNMRERMARVESTITHLLDPEIGIYARLYMGQQRLSAWAIAVLTALLATLIGLIVHIVAGS